MQVQSALAAQQAAAGAEIERLRREQEVCVWVCVEGGTRGGTVCTSSQ